MAQASHLQYHHCLAHYFRDSLAAQSADETSPPHQDTLWYLGDMLARFSDSEEVFCYEEGALTLRPLALLYGDAREASTARERSALLRHLGDLALFIGALFPESYRRRGLRKDYLVGMGGAAYAYLAENAAPQRHIFSELAAGFTCILELVARACHRRHLFDAGEILALIERWRQTQNPLLKRQLEAIGVDTERGFYLQ